MLRELRGSSTFKYVQGPGTDEPLAQEDGSGALTYYHADGLGSVVKRTSQAGAVTHEYRYDAWGNIEIGASEPVLDEVDERLRRGLHQQGDALPKSCPSQLQRGSALHGGQRLH